MLKHIVITDHVGVKDVEKFMTEVLRKQGIKLVKIGLIALSPFPPKSRDIFVAMELKIPIGAEVDFMENEG